MGSANSNAESLEKRRIEREMRLGLYVGSTTGLNPNHMGMRPVNPYQHLGWPAQEWLLGPAVSPPVPPATPRTQPIQPHVEAYPQRSQPPPIATYETPPRQRQQPRAILVPVVAESSFKTPNRHSETRASTPTPTRLRWVGTPAKTDPSPSTLDLLTPARRSLRYLQSQETDSKRSSSSHKINHERNSNQSLAKRDRQPYRSKTPVIMKPSMKQALYLLSVEEVEERACLLNEEVNAFDVIIALFSYAVEMECIRVAAFEMFELEAKARKSISSQEKRERHIVAYWIAENYEDAKLAERIRLVQSRPSAQRTPSRSPWRFPLSPSEDRFVRPSDAAESQGKSSFLANLHASPSPVPPGHGASSMRGGHLNDSRFGVPNKYVADVSDNAEDHIGAAGRVAARHEAAAAGHNSPLRSPAKSAMSQGNRQSHASQGGAQALIASMPSHAYYEVPELASVTTNKLQPPEGFAKGQTSIPSDGYVRISSNVKAASGDASLPASQRFPAQVAAASKPLEPMRNASPTVAPRQEEHQLQLPPDQQEGPQSNEGDYEHCYYYYYDNDDHDPTVSVGTEETQAPAATGRGKQPKPSTRLSLHASQPRGQDTAASCSPAAPPVPHTSVVTSSPRKREQKAHHHEEAKRQRAAPAHEKNGVGVAVIPPVNVYRKGNDPLPPSRLLDELSPIHAYGSEESASSGSSVYLDPLAQMTPKRKPPPLPLASWAPDLERHHGELDRRIMQQRRSMSGSPGPLRVAPAPPVSPPESAPLVNGHRESSAAVVTDRFAALLNGLDQSAH